LFDRADPFEYKAADRFSIIPSLQADRVDYVRLKPDATGEEKPPG
jgi:hypothetical protein